MNRTKTISGVRIKNAELGIVEAVFASRLLLPGETPTKDHVDKDGDVTYASALTDGQRVVVSAWQHGSWAKGPAALPYGYGTIHVKGTEAVLEAQFLMDTDHGRNAFVTVKALSEHEVQEWSYSLHDVKASTIKIEGSTYNALESIFVKEVSPVMIGSGIDTRTLATKAAGDDTPLVLESLGAYIERRKAWASEVRDQLRQLATDRFATEEHSWCWVRDYDPDEGLVVVEVETYSEDDGYDFRLVQVDYDVDADGTITLGDSETDVRSVTTYAPKAGATFAEHCTAVLTSVQALSNRAAAVVTQRTGAGKSKALSADRRADLEQAVAGLQAVLDSADAVASKADAVTPDEVAKADALFADSLVSYQLTKQGAIS